MSKRVLLIGVGKYLHGYIDLTSTVDSDIRLIHESLSLVGVLDIQRLGFGGQLVSYSDLRSAIAQFLTSAPAESDLLIYYSGHGHFNGDSTYLVPSDAHPELPDPLNYLVNLSFDNEVEASQARSISFIVDACRTTIELEESPTVPASSKLNSSRTTVIFGSSPGQAARIMRGQDASSLFTRAFARLITAATEVVPLSKLKERLQLVTVEQAKQAGLDAAPTIEILIGSQVDLNQSFKFLRPHDSGIQGRRWSTVLATQIGDLPESYSQQINTIFEIVDRYETEAPTFVDQPALRAWHDPALLNRLAQASLLFLRRIDTTPVENLVIIGIVAALEAAIREQESSASYRKTRVLARLAVISPQLVDAYSTHSHERQELLAAFCDHVLALRETIKSSERFLAYIAEITTVTISGKVRQSVAEISRYLIDCLNHEFLGGEFGSQKNQYPIELAPPTRKEGSRTIDGNKIAALIHLIWLFAADTRILAPQFGLNLIQDNINIESTLQSFSGISWIDLGEVIDLSLLTESAALDQVLRQLTEDITATLIRVSQPGMPLQQVNIPMAATATRLGPRADAYRLPHIRFELSAAETHELLMGTNLYGNAQIAIRELYQNAVDACMYRRWRIVNVSPQALSDWRPEVVFSWGTDEEGIWVECRDNGVGMSDFELRESFAKVGKRFRDLPEFFEETETWGSGEAQQFRPISQFGIGVLSYFMIAEKVVINTVRSHSNGSLGDPLEVRIASTASLFQLVKRPITRPLGGGTIVRLYLRPEFKDFNLTEVLYKVIAAPIIPTRLHGADEVEMKKYWIPGHLYRNDGLEIDCFAVPDLGVYFHEGFGRVLINGIPLSFSSDRSSDIGRAAVLSSSLGLYDPRLYDNLELRGLTISIDSRCSPRLRVDRAGLLSVDVEVLRRLVAAAAARVSGWNSASLSWLLSLFYTDPRAGRIAYRSLENVDLMVGDLVQFPGASIYPSAENADPATRVQTSRIGVSVYDISILNPVPGAGTGSSTTPLFFERQRLLLSKSTRRKRSGFPQFDDRLLTILTASDRAILQRTIPNIDGQTLSSFDSEDLLPINFGALCNIAAELDVSIGAVALFIWALDFLSHSRHLLITKVSSGIISSRESKAVLTVGSGKAGFLPFISDGDLDQSLTDLLSIASQWDSDIYTVEELSRVFHLNSSERAVMQLFEELTPEIKKILARHLQSSASWKQFLSAPETWLSNAFGPNENEGVRADLMALHENIKQEVSEVAGSWFGRRQDRHFLTSNSVQDSLSSPARLALSRDLDEEPPYYTTSVPAINIAAAAYYENIDPDLIAGELTRHGYLPENPDNWDMLRPAAELLPSGDLDLVSNYGFDDEGRFELCDTLNELADLCRAMGPERVGKLATELSAIGIASDSTARIAKTELPSAPILSRHSDTISGGFPIRVDIVTLVSLANEESITLGEAFAWLKRYRPLIDPLWMLPESLPSEVNDRSISSVERDFFVGTPIGKSYPRDWFVIAIRASVISGRPLGAMVDSVSPLLLAVGESIDAFREVVKLGRDAVTFDDLLILGALWAWPNISAPEIVAVCKPSCRFPDSLRDRANRLVDSIQAVNFTY